MKDPTQFGIAKRVKNAGRSKVMRVRELFYVSEVRAVLK